MSVYEDMNVINLSVLDEAALSEFFTNNVNKHFWFQRTDIGIELKYVTVSEQTGHLWWKKVRRAAKLANFTPPEGDDYNVCSDIAKKFGHLIEEHLPSGYEITIMATLKFIRIDCPYKGTYRQPVYDYNVVNVVDRNSNRQLSMEEIIDFCGKTKLRAPDFEVGEYMFLSLGEMFKSFESFKKYVRECDKDHYELIAFRATEEIR